MALAAERSPLPPARRPFLRRRRASREKPNKLSASEVGFCRANGVRAGVRFRAEAAPAPPPPQLLARSCCSGWRRFYNAASEPVQFARVFDLTPTAVLLIVCAAELSWGRRVFWSGFWSRGGSGCSRPHFRLPNSLPWSAPGHCATRGTTRSVVVSQSFSKVARPKRLRGRHSSLLP